MFFSCVSLRPHNSKGSFKSKNRHPCFWRTGVGENVLQQLAKHFYKSHTSQFKRHLQTILPFFCTPDFLCFRSYFRKKNFQKFRNFQIRFLCQETFNKICSILSKKKVEFFDIMNPNAKNNKLHGNTEEISRKKKQKISFLVKTLSMLGSSQYPRRQRSKSKSKTFSKRCRVKKEREMSKFQECVNVGVFHWTRQVSVKKKEKKSNAEKYVVRTCWRSIYVHRKKSSFTYSLKLHIYPFFLFPTSKKNLSPSHFRIRMHFSCA